MLETEVKEFNIGVENELRKDEHSQEVIETLEVTNSREERKNTLLRLHDPHF
jgi:hypothetical protein